MSELHDKARLWQARSKNTRYKGQIQEADEIIAALLAEVERLELAIKRQAAAAKQLHSAERALISADRDAAEKARKLTDSKALNGILEANDRLDEIADAALQEMARTGEQPAQPEQPADVECGKCVGTGSQQVRGFGVTAEFGPCPSCNGSGQKLPEQSGGVAPSEWRKRFWENPLSSTRRSECDEYTWRLMVLCQDMMAALEHTARPAPAVPDALKLPPLYADETPTSEREIVCRRRGEVCALAGLIRELEARPADALEVARKRLNRAKRALKNTHERGVTWART